MSANSLLQDLLGELADLHESAAEMLTRRRSSRNVIIRDLGGDAVERRRRSFRRRARTASRRIAMPRSRGSKRCSKRSRTFARSTSAQRVRRIAESRRRMRRSRRATPHPRRARLEPDPPALPVPVLHPADLQLRGGHHLAVRGPATSNGALGEAAAAADHAQSTAQARLRSCTATLKRGTAMAKRARRFTDVIVLSRSHRPEGHQAAESRRSPATTSSTAWTSCRALRLRIRRRRLRTKRSERMFTINFVDTNQKAIDDGTRTTRDRTISSRRCALVPESQGGPGLFVSFGGGVERSWQLSDHWFLTGELQSSGAASVLIASISPVPGSDEHGRFPLRVRVRRPRRSRRTTASRSTWRSRPTRASPPTWCASKARSRRRRRSSGSRCSARPRRSAPTRSTTSSRRSCRRTGCAWTSMPASVSA